MVKGLGGFSCRLLPWYIFLLFLPHFFFFSHLLFIYSRVKWGNCYNGRMVFVVQLVMAIGLRRKMHSPISF
ncbi:hypothetical protein J3E72DRAFT_346587 [Bipolaris maydis]|nr:hypothetical protein J3E72DRAFT_346587 [Bipolaris maydis]